VGGVRAPAGYGHHAVFLVCGGIGSAGTRCEGLQSINTSVLTPTVSGKGFTPKPCAKFVLKILKRDSIH